MLKSGIFRRSFHGQWVGSVWIRHCLEQNSQQLNGPLSPSQAHSLGRSICFRAGNWKGWGWLGGGRHTVLYELLRVLLTEFPLHLYPFFGFPQAALGAPCLGHFLAHMGLETNKSLFFPCGSSQELKGSCWNWDFLVFASYFDTDV